MIVSLIAAVAEGRVIGSGGHIPWDLPADRALFRRTTWGHPLLVGRRTYEALGRPLPGREMVVLSRRESYRAQECRVAGSVEEALAPYRGAGTEVFVAGGGEVYALALPLADRLYITWVAGRFPGDTLFPEVEWGLFSPEPEAPLEGAPGCSFRRYLRRG